MAEQGQRLRVEISALTLEGDGLALRDGDEVRVGGVVPGEVVLVEVVRRRRRYLYARLVELVAASSRRIEPACPYFGLCTGCQWQHMDYACQLELKADHVRNCFRGAGMEDVPVRSVLGMADPWHYRNHARFTVDRQGRVGFVHRETRRFVPVDRCRIMHPWINEALSLLQGKCAGQTQLSVRYGVNTGQWLIQPRLEIPGFPLATGQRYYEERLLGHSFRISSPSFFQVNLSQAERLVSVLLRYLEPRWTEALMDAYAGVGTFAVLFSAHVAKAIAVEESAAAIRDARVNVSMLPNIELVQARVEAVLGSIPVVPDMVVLDPPRAGCHPDALAALARRAPQRVVYVSCEPASLSRDVATLCRSGYRLVEVQPVDMFPQTRQVECVALLEKDQRARGSPEPRLLLASASPRRVELLSCLGLQFDMVQPHVDESGMLVGGGSPQQKAERSALAKAGWASECRLGEVIIAADTIVVDGERILGKPAGASEAVEMLRRLHAGTHEVVTGLAVVSSGKVPVASHVTTKVIMRPYSDAEIEAYVASGAYADKAGSYGIQDVPFSPTAAVEGCYLNVVGLPLCELKALLGRVGVRVPEGFGSRLPSVCQSCRWRTA
ncbi:MAG: Maf family nucleotide pyrophosphatase [Chloroflexota bacterium]